LPESLIRKQLPTTGVEQFVGDLGRQVDETRNLPSFGSAFPQPMHN
jgi:hypothetical protein